MTRFWNRIAVWFSLHEPVRISESSHGSVFEFSVYRVHNEHGSGLGPALLLPVQSARTSSQRYNTHPNTHNIYIYRHTHSYILIHTHTHITYIYNIYSHANKHKYNLHIYIPKHTNLTQTHTHTHSHSQHTSMHAYTL